MARKTPSKTASPNSLGVPAGETQETVEQTISAPPPLEPDIPPAPTYESPARSPAKVFRDGKLLAMWRAARTVLQSAPYLWNHGERLAEHTYHEIYMDVAQALWILCDLPANSNTFLTLDYQQILDRYLSHQTSREDFMWFLEEVRRLELTLDRCPELAVGKHDQGDNALRLRHAISVAIARLSAREVVGQWAPNSPHGINADAINQAAGREIVITAIPDGTDHLAYLGIRDRWGGLAERWRSSMASAGGSVQGARPCELIVQLQSWLPVAPASPRAEPAGSSVDVPDAERSQASGRDDSAGGSVEGARSGELVVQLSSWLPGAPESPPASAPAEAADSPVDEPDAEPLDDTETKILWAMAKEPLENERRPILALTHEDIAARTGLGRKTIGKRMAGLQKAKLVKRRKGRNSITPRGLEVVRALCPQKTHK